MPLLDISRRLFLILGSAATGTFVIGAGVLPAAPAGAQVGPGIADAAGSRRLNSWLEIAPSGAVTVTVARVEMGQGTYTSLAMLAIKELDYPWANVRVAHAPTHSDHANLGMFFGPDNLPGP